jgi:hypothetical protein
VTLRGGTGVLAAALTLLGLTSIARADDAVRVVIAGGKKDPIALRLEKELVALGFAPIAVGAIPNCTDDAVETAVKNAGASAALCSSGQRVAVWTDDGNEVKLRDTVVAKDSDTIAMQAAEVMRANIAFGEPEPEPAPPPTPAPAPATGSWDEFEDQDRPPPKPKEIVRNTAFLAVSAGASYLASSSASHGGFSAAASYGIHRYFSLAAHLDAPYEGTRATPMSTVSDGSKVRMTPGIAGLGLEVPFVGPTSIVVPRVGAYAGVAWIYASKSEGQVNDQFGGAVSTTPASSDTIFAPAGWVSASFSFRLMGPLRAVVDGLVGSTAGGVLVRNQGQSIARWGVPFGSAGFRAEILLP